MFESIFRLTLPKSLNVPQEMGKTHPHPRISLMTPGLDRGEGKLATDQDGEDSASLLIILRS